MLPEGNCWSLANEKENSKKGGEIFRHRLPSLFYPDGYANLGRRFLLSTNANLKGKIMQLDSQILFWYPEWLPPAIADVLAAQLNLTREEIRALHKKQLGL